jgi:hypothetical protein
LHINSSSWVHSIKSSIFWIGIRELIVHIHDVADVTLSVGLRLLGSHCRTSSLEHIRLSFIFSWSDRAACTLEHIKAIVLCLGRLSVWWLEIWEATLSWSCCKWPNIEQVINSLSSRRNVLVCCRSF